MRLFVLSAVLLSIALQAAEVRIPVTVATTESTPLKPSDFEVALEGTAETVDVVRVGTPNEDLLLMLVMDTVGDLAYVEPARRALVERFADLPERTLVTLLRAQDGLRVVTDPTTSSDVLTESLAAIPVAGKSALLDTIETASRLADAVATKSNVRVAILYITDSDVRNYREDFTNPVINSSDSRDLSRRFPEGLIRERISRLDSGLAEFQTPIFIVHLRSSSGSRLDEAYQTGLLQLAIASGGNAQFCRSSAEIPDAISRAIHTIASQYRVHVQIPVKSRKTVNLTLASAGRPVTYRKSFVLR